MSDFFDSLESRLVTAERIRAERESLEEKRLAFLDRDDGTDLEVYLGGDTAFATDFLDTMRGHLMVGGCNLRASEARKVQGYPVGLCDSKSMRMSRHLVFLCGDETLRAQRETEGHLEGDEVVYDVQNLPTDSEFSPGLAYWSWLTFIPGDDSIQYSHFRRIFTIGIQPMTVREALPRLAVYMTTGGYKDPKYL